MDFNRNQLFLIGLVLIFLGYQFRMFESFTLNERCTRFIEARMRSAKNAVGQFQPASYNQFDPPPTIQRTVTPPRWIGLAMISVGAVIVLHALALRKPGG